MFLGGIKFKEFLSDYGEWHALVFGVCETIYPGEPQHPKMTKTLAKQIEKESHYYRTGRVLGWMVRVGFIVGITLGMIAGVVEIIKAVM